MILLGKFIQFSYLLVLGGIGLGLLHNWLVPVDYVCPFCGGEGCEHCCHTGEVYPTELDADIVLCPRCDGNGVYPPGAYTQVTCLYCGGSGETTLAAIDFDDDGRDDDGAAWDRAHDLGVDYANGVW
ncbi:hypothetical protein A5733_04320 [Mycobacterium sp. NS-7484]|uniref:hypothetical protein n=1 Tax=Mycobacterium sp. NS-7484 TaxID=1834161 RepID=UPI00096F5FB8|nr:hypothetical protein [Mycobacterium sp. NS-7484]OMC00342.1 hypothetical protein A5733_04320 [Mycobacterium sp. NS-7484]